MISLLVSHTISAPAGWKVSRNGSIVGFHPAKADAIRYAIELANRHWSADGLPCHVQVEDDQHQRVIHYVAGEGNTVPMALPAEDQWPDASVPDCSHEHAVLLYETDEALLSRLEDFVLEGIGRNESVVFIGTKAHRDHIANAIEAGGFSVAGLTRLDRLFMLDAAETLWRFMDGGMPNPESFGAVIGEVLERATAGGRKVRAFGEMVALLWEQRNYAATVRVETLWSDLCARHDFPLLCAYPRNCMEGARQDAVVAVCKAHSVLVTA